MRVANVLAAVVIFFAPLASVGVMASSNDERMKAVVRDPYIFGLADLHVQLITTFSALVTLMAFAYIIASENGSNRIDKVTATGVLFFAFVWFIWLFAMSGAAQFVPLELYVPKQGDVWGPGIPRIPPAGSLLTITRVGVIFATLVLVSLPKLRVWAPRIPSWFASRSSKP